MVQGLGPEVLVLRFWADEGSRSSGLGLVVKMDLELQAPEPLKAIVEFIVFRV